MEASLGSQLWRGVRFCLSLLVGLTVLTVVFEEKGLGRGMLNNPDHRPEQVSRGQGWHFWGQIVGQRMGGCL